MPKKNLEPNQISAKINLNLWELDTLDDLLDNYLGGPPVRGIDQSAVISIQAKLFDIMEVVNGRLGFTSAGSKNQYKHIM
jgi:hypothetical protein